MPTAIHASQSQLSHFCANSKMLPKLHTFFLYEIPELQTKKKKTLQVIHDTTN